MEDCEWITSVIASSDSNEGYTLSAIYRRYEDGVSPLRFELETFGEITFSLNLAEKFIKKMKRAEKNHAATNQRREQ
jgi:hypothetical protein